MDNKNDTIGEITEIALVGEDGEQMLFEHVLTFMYENERYMALIPAEQSNEEIKKKVAFSLLIYLTIIPFELKFYQGINPTSVVLITVLSPLFIFVAFLSLFCLYGSPIYSLVNFFIKIASSVLSFLTKFAFQINAPPMSGLIIIVFMILLLAFLYYKSIEFIPLYRSLLIIVIGFITIYCLPIENWVTTAVYFINVGQGDSCLIRKGNTAIMIDTGGLKNTDLAKQTLIPFLQKEKI